MKSIDFSHTGGMPLTQNRLDYLQTAYSEVLQALAGIAGDGSVPVILSGMVMTGFNTVSNGWFYYNGQIVKFTGGSVTPSGGDVALILLTTTATPLTFNDGSTPNVILETSASLITGSPVTDATHFPTYVLSPSILGQLAAINNTLTNIESAWLSGGAITAIPSGGGTFSGGTTLMNNFKMQDVSSTFLWQLSLRGWTISGTVNSILIDAPSPFFAGGASWAVNGIVIMGQIYSTGAAPAIVQGTLGVNFSGFPVITLKMGGGPFTPATVNIDMTVVTQI